VGPPHCPHHKQDHVLLGCRGRQGKILPQFSVPTLLLSFLAGFHCTQKLSSRLCRCDLVFEWVRLCVEMVWKCSHTQLMGGSSGPCWFATGSEAHCPSPLTHHGQDHHLCLDQPEFGCRVWCNPQLTGPNHPTTSAVGARAELPCLPRRAEHNPSGEAHSKPKRCKIASRCRVNLW